MKGEKWLHSRGNVGKCSLHGASGNDMMGIILYDFQLTFLKSVSLDFSRRFSLDPSSTGTIFSLKMIFLVEKNHKEIEQITFFVHHMSNEKKTWLVGLYRGLYSPVI